MTFLETKIALVLRSKVIYPFVFGLKPKKTEVAALGSSFFMLAIKVLENVEAKLHGESKVIQRYFDDNNDDDKGDDKKLKDQSKNNSSESTTIQEFKIRIKKNSRTQ